MIGLELIIDEAEGYAFLRQGDSERDNTEEREQQTLPRLVQRRPLSYPVSLLCVLLRKRLVEQDAGGGETRVILSCDQIIDMMRVYLPEKGNEAKSIDQISRHIISTALTLSRFNHQIRKYLASMWKKILVFM